MDDPNDSPLPHTSESEKILPDVVHSQQIPVVGFVVDETDAPHITANVTEIPVIDVENISECVDTESISEHIPSRLDYSVSETENISKNESQGLHKGLDKTLSLNVPFSQLPGSENPSEDPGGQSSSWPDNVASDIHHLSEESSVNLAPSSDLSKSENPEQSIQSPKLSQEDSLKESPRSEYLDSLNEESSHKSNISIGDKVSIENSNSLEEERSSPKLSSGSEEIIKLDIRGQGKPKFPLAASKIFFGPPPEGSNIIGSNKEPIPVFQNLLSPFLVGAGDLKVEDVFKFSDMYKETSPSHSPELQMSNEPSPDRTNEELDKSILIEQDVLVEEVTVDQETKMPDTEIEQPETSIPTQPKSIAAEETMSFSTLSTDYKTICEEYHVKLVHLEDAITNRDKLIEELTVSLQQSVHQRDDLRTENDHLINEVQNLQHIVAEHSHSDHDTIKGQLSDFVKYENMVKDDSTKFYSAIMSGGSSIQSSNGEKDMDREEITVNYSRSDLKSTGSSDFQVGFEDKVVTVINKFDELIEENLRNKLRESIIQVLCDEIGKLRLESDTDIKQLEAQMQQDRQSFNIESRRLREMLATVKAGNVDIEELRQELNVKHEKEMGELRMYFERKCSDMERSYSEEVWRGKSCGSPGLGSLEAEAGDQAAGDQAAGDRAAGDQAAGDQAAGDHARRRTRSAEFHSFTFEPTQLEQALKQASKKHEQHIEELKTEQTAYLNDLQARHKETIASLEEQITQLKAHIQTSENTEASVPLYQQDIDLELEKERDAMLEKRLEEVRQEVVNQIQEQIQVLLSDPDAEVSSWPLELVALRDKIYGEARTQDKDVTGVESGKEADKWKQRRNISFDQNRQLEEVTKERDGLKQVATSLHRVVGQLVSYCACAEDELNRTVLTQLLARLHSQDQSIEEESRPSTPNLSIDLNTSITSRGSRHVHFAPDLNSILADLDEDGLVRFFQHQRDLSVDIKKELEHSLMRLRHEAHELLDLSAKITANKRPDRMLESSQGVQISELVEEIDSRHKHCDNCELHRKNMEEAMSECLQREGLLRAELETALLRIAQLCGDGSDVIAEGYGTGHPAAAPPPPWRRAPAPASPRPEGGDIDAALKERDDLQQQLEAANRQLRSTRQFVEEQAAEREAERDEFARRLTELREENSRLTTRLQNNARILNEVEQLESQTREMNQIISELESKKLSMNEEIKSQEEKIELLRDIIAELENKLEQKTNHESEVLKQLAEMKNVIDDRDSKLRSLLGELESLRSERVDSTDVVCVKCGQEEDKYGEFMEKIKEQCQLLEDKIHRRIQRMERIHEVCSTSCSEPSEDVSLRDQRNDDVEMQSPSPPSPRVDPLPVLGGVWQTVHSLSRAEDAALKRIADLEMQRNQLKDVAQEVRAERDVLQARMAEQALRVSSLAARLQRHRDHAAQDRGDHASQLAVELHDTRAEMQRLKEELESKDKQLVRLKQTIEEKEKLEEKHQTIYGNSCNPKDKVIILERELSSAQTRIAQLESLARSLEDDKDQLHSSVRELQRALAEKEEQLNEILALKLNEEKDEKSEIIEGKVSARTLSDIVSISDFDEQDLQMRRAELKNQQVNLSGAPFDVRDKTINKSIHPEVQKAHMSSLNLEYGDHFDVTSYTPRADSLPAHLTSTQNRDLFKQFKRNVNETTVFGDKHSTAQNIPDNCSMYPNRDISASKNVTVEPKKINFSLETTNDNRNQDEEEFTSLRELGITLDIRQENFPDILTQLKHEIKKSRTELQNCKSELKNAEEQLCEFPALKEEVEELKGLLENTMATMENDKKFYENQLDNFSSNKKLLEQRLTELTQEVNDKAKDLHLLKEDILRRENMILELAKEKRNLTNKLAELEGKIDELQSRNTILEKFESENLQMKDKISELKNLQQTVSEKNQQIDSLNQHLDRLDDLQRCLDDKTEALDNLKEAYEEKSNELFQLQNSVQTSSKDIEIFKTENDKLNTENKELKLKLSKLEKEQENASLKIQNSESELERVNSLNDVLTSKIDELKELTDRLKDKETEIEILNEDINAFHEEIASLKEQLQIVSRSPSPKKSDDKKTPDRQASNDKKQLVKIRKQISLLQHELDFNKKELNDKAFELAKSNLDCTELRNNLSQATKQVSDAEQSRTEYQKKCEELDDQVMKLCEEKEDLQQQLRAVVNRIREESNVGELKSKLREKSERIRELEQEMQDLKDLVDRLRASSPRGSPAEERQALVLSGTRSPTAELERAVRDQLDYSHTLDEDIMEQILSASSDDREDIPRLALNTSKSSSSIHSSSSERLMRLRSDNDKLTLQVNNLECRLRDKDALITELNRIRDKLVSDWQTSKLRYEVERDNSGRLQLLLDTHKETAQSLQNQDTNMIQILKKRLESSMASELELQQREQQLRSRVAQLERQVISGDKLGQDVQHEELDRLRSEISLLKSKLEVEKSRYMDLQALLDHTKLQAQRDLEAKNEQCSALRSELADLKRAKHEAGVELLRARELLNIQNGTVGALEKKLATAQLTQRPIDDALTEIECHKSELSREIATLKKCLSESSNPELIALRAERKQLVSKIEELEKEKVVPGEDKEQAIRYLHGRCLRLESCRKALVWQKRYLQRVVAGYSELERGLRVNPPSERSTGKARFKCAALVVVSSLRLVFLLRRRRAARTLAQQALLAREPQHSFMKTMSTPLSRERGTMSRDSLSRRVLKQELRLNMPVSPGVGDFVRRSPYPNSPREEPFILSPQRGEMAAAYFNKLELVSRCLNQAMDASRDVP